MTTSTPEIQESLNNLTSSWEDFKSLNEKKLLDISKKSSAYPFILEKLEKAENTIEEQNERLERLEISSQRPIIHDAKDLNEDYNYKMFTEYLSKGTSQKNDFTSDPSYFMPRNISLHIEKNVTKNSIMRQLCSIEKISGDSLECLVTEKDITSVQWSTGSQAGDTTLPKIKVHNIQLNELYAQPQITKKLLEDSVIDIAGWLINYLVDAFSRAENQAFISGDGNGKPYGILSYIKSTEIAAPKPTILGSEPGSAPSTTSSTASSPETGPKSTNPESQPLNEVIACQEITSDAIINLYYSLDEYFASKAAFIMHRSVLQEIRSIKLPSGQYICHPGLTLGSPDTLMGLPVYQTSDMPNSTIRDHPIIALADFKNAYKIVENNSIKILRDPFTTKPFIKFYTTKRVGGAIINHNAIKFLKITALSTR